MLTWGNKLSHWEENEGFRAHVQDGDLQSLVVVPVKDFGMWGRFSNGVQMTGHIRNVAA